MGDGKVHYGIGGQATTCGNQRTWLAPLGSPGRIGDGEIFVWSAGGGHRRKDVEVVLGEYDRLTGRADRVILQRIDVPHR